MKITFVLDIITFVHQSLVFYRVQFCNVSARIMRMSTKNVYYISIDNELEWDTFETNLKVLL